MTIVYLDKNSMVVNEFAYDYSCNLTNVIMLRVHRTVTWNQHFGAKRNSAENTMGMMVEIFWW